LNPCSQVVVVKSWRPPLLSEPFLLTGDWNDLTGRPSGDLLDLLRRDEAETGDSWMNSTSDANLCTRLFVKVPAASCDISEVLYGQPLAVERLTVYELAPPLAFQVSATLPFPAVAVSPRRRGRRISTPTVSPTSAGISAAAGS